MGFPEIRISKVFDPEAEVVLYQGDCLDFLSRRYFLSVSIKVILIDVG